MGERKPLLIETRDCSPFEHPPNIQLVVSAWMKQSNASNVLHLTDRRKQELHFAEYHPQEGRWWAGRMVGESQFEYEGQLYRISVKPRFGNRSLFHFIETLFNIRLPPSVQNHKKSQSEMGLIKLLICYLWITKLAKANQHGLPKTNQQNYHKGFTVKGRLDIRKSIVPIHRTGEVVSVNYHKSPNTVVFRVLNEAYQLLKVEYGLGQLHLPEHALEAIHQFNQSNYSQSVTQAEYQRIRYRPIDQGFKPIVDLSWDLIQKQKLTQSSNSFEQSLGLFLDMAEIWEAYLRTLIKREFSPEGWSVESEKVPIYTDTFFRRHMIPDIVMKKGSQTMVWDAKYKKMAFRNFDVDRSDLYQIHTYMQYYALSTHLLAGGLIYPLSQVLHHQTHDKLLSQGSTPFAIEGIQIPDENLPESEYKLAFQNSEKRFLQSLKNHCMSLPK